MALLWLCTAVDDCIFEAQRWVNMHLDQRDYAILVDKILKSEYRAIGISTASRALGFPGGKTLEAMIQKGLFGKRVCCPPSIYMHYREINPVTLSGTGYYFGFVSPYFIQHKTLFNLR